MDRPARDRRPDEIVVARGQRNGYDHALRAAGARLVEVGLAEPLAGAGIRNAEPWEYAAAIGPRTAAILYVARPAAQPALPEVAEVARAHGLPLIVDAAAELPPQANLRRFIDEGADLVVFSGGKVLGGPAGTGLMAGRAELIASAALQCLDIDVRWADWHPPADFIDKTRLQRPAPAGDRAKPARSASTRSPGLSRRSITSSPRATPRRHARWLETCRRIADGLGPAPALRRRDRGGRPDRPRAARRPALCRRGRRRAALRQRLVHPPGAGAHGLRSVPARLPRRQPGLPPRGRAARGPGGARRADIAPGSPLDTIAVRGRSIGLSDITDRCPL